MWHADWSRDLKGLSPRSPNGMVVAILHAFGVACMMYWWAIRQPQLQACGHLVSCRVPRVLRPWARLTQLLPIVQIRARACVLQAELHSKYLQPLAKIKVYTREEEKEHMARVQRLVEGLGAFDSAA